MVDLVTSHDIDENWLTNGQLDVCFLKLQTPPLPTMIGNESRPINLEILRKTLTQQEGGARSLLEQEVNTNSAILLAPELAFGSVDFDAIDELVGQASNCLILVAGFGFSDGQLLIDQDSLAHVTGIWSAPPIANKNYNGAWVWVKSSESIHCYICLKNYPEQQREIAVPNLVFGNEILRLEFNDLVVFPLVCADLISTQENSPAKRIVESLKDVSNADKKTLITASLLNYKSHSGYWKDAIGDLLQTARAYKTRVLLCNCVNPDPLVDEDEDKWRCLTGGYGHLDDTRPPQLPLPNLRYVKDTKYSGLVLRNPEHGCVFTKLSWTNNASEGAHILTSAAQHVLSDNLLVQCDGDCAADELFRFISKHKGGCLHEMVELTETSMDIAKVELEDLLQRLAPGSNDSLRKFSGEIFSKCLAGVDYKKPICADDLSMYKKNLDCAVTTMMIIRKVISADLLSLGEELEYGQLLDQNSDSEILVWDTANYKSSQLYDKVKGSVSIRGGSARRLTVIGRGNNAGTLPPNGRVRTTRLDDIGISSSSADLGSEERDITMPKDRVVFWQNQGEIDDILSSVTSEAQLQTAIDECLKLTIGEANA